MLTKMHDTLLKINTALESRVDSQSAEMTAMTSQIDSLSDYNRLLQKAIDDITGKKEQGAAG